VALETTAELVQQIADTDGVAVTYGGGTTYGHFASPGAVVHEGMGGGVIVDAPSVVVVSRALAAPLVQDAGIVVDSLNYTVGEFRPLDDGVLTLITLEPV